MATKRAPDYYFVCLKCLEDNPRNFELTTRKCISQDAHLNSRSVRVWEWRHNGILEIYPSVNDKPVVRPQPMFLNFSGNFKLCHKATSNGCRNRACNHAHSVEEMERWNAIKAQPRLTRKFHTFIHSLYGGAKAKYAQISLCHAQSVLNATHTRPFSVFNNHAIYVLLRGVLYI